MKRRPKGRPKGVRFEQQIAIRLSPEQHAKWEAAANEMNMTMSVWIRYMIDSALKRGES